MQHHAKTLEIYARQHHGNTFKIMLKHDNTSQIMPGTMGIHAEPCQNNENACKPMQDNEIYVNPYLKQWKYMQGHAEPIKIHTYPCRNHGST